MLLPTHSIDFCPLQSLADNDSVYLCVYVIKLYGSFSHQAVAMPYLEKSMLLDATDPVFSGSYY